MNEDPTRAPDPLLAQFTREGLPMTIGAYRIVKLLGEGGMGAVYLAEQQNPRRAVALKVIKGGMADAEFLLRFHREAELLGRLQHPGIAQIYEAGTASTAFGHRPFFAMEFIQGKSLREYAETQHLNTSQRLELVAQVCEAVHHAHQRGIIHRDLKPSNILVNESGQPKILDFGVARVTDSDAQATRQTDLGQVIGTLAYMSPEQVIGDPLELDTRSDVYALGVILYELLAGRPPYIVSRKLHEAVRTIRDEDPAPLSSMSRNYRGDITNIVAKALEKDKTRRYASASGLAEDIRRYLQDEPILANPPSAMYQLQKFARRHKALVGATAAVFAVVLVGAVVSTREAIRANRAERVAAVRLTEATQEAAKAQAVNAFMQDMLRAANPRALTREDRDKGRDVTVLHVLDGAVRQLDAGMLHAQPLVEAAARETLGSTFFGLGSYDKAEYQLRAAFGLRRPRLSADNAEVLNGVSKLAALLAERSKLTEAEALHRGALQTRLQLFGPQHADVAESMNGLAEVLISAGKTAEAEDLYRHALAIDLKTGSPKAHEVAHNLGVLLYQQNRLADAEASLRQSLALKHDVTGDEHPDVAITMNQLSYVYHREQKLAESEKYARASLAMSQRFYGNEHPDVAIALGHLAGLYLDERKLDEAESTYREALGLARKMMGNEHEQTATLASNLGRVLRTRGHLAESVALLREAMDTREKVLPSGNWRTLESKSRLGEALAEQGYFQRAEPLLLAAYSGLKTEPSAPEPSRRQALERVAQFYRRWNEQQPQAGKRDVAATWQARVAETPK